jgi:hypothetical protein
MRTLKRELLITGLTVIMVGMLSATAVVGAKQPRQSSRGGKGYDLYIRQDQKTVPLPQQGLTFKSALVLGSDQSGLYGIPTPPKTTLDLKPVEIVFFDPETAGATVRLTRLAHIVAAPAHSFDLQATKISPAIFPKIYHVEYDASLPINLWCVETEIPLQITPMAGKPGWFRAVPDQQLEAGVFAITLARVDGPRIYAGDRHFYPFVLASVPQPLNPPGKKPAGPQPTPPCP